MARKAVTITFSLSGELDAFVRKRAEQRSGKKTGAVSRYLRDLVTADRDKEQIPNLKLRNDLVEFVRKKPRGSGRRKKPKR
jgi:hypothetical protein